MQPAAVLGMKCTQHFPLPTQFPVGLQRGGTWQRSRWVWDAQMSRGMLQDAQSQTKSFISKRKHKLLWLQVNQSVHFALGPSKPSNSTFCRVSAFIQFPRGAFRQELPRPRHADPRCRRSGITARIRSILHSARCFVVLFLLLPYRPQRHPCSLGQQTLHVHPQPTLYPPGTTTGPEGWDNESPRASHVLLARNKTSPLPG